MCSGAWQTVKRRSATVLTCLFAGALAVWQITCVVCLFHCVCPHISNHIFKVTLCNNSIIFVALKNLFSYKICCCVKLQEIFGHLKAKVYFFFYAYVMVGTHHKIIGLILGRFLPFRQSVPIILVDLKIILSDFSVVWGVLRVTESARKNVRGAPMANRKHI